MAFEINDWREEVSGDPTDLFSAVNIDHTLKQLLPSLFNEFHDHNIGCSPLVLSCCLLAFLWLLDEHGESLLAPMSTCMDSPLTISHTYHLELVGKLCSKIKTLIFMFGDIHFILIGT